MAVRARNLRGFANWGSTTAVAAGWEMSGVGKLKEWGESERRRGRGDRFFVSLENCKISQCSVPDET